MEETIDYETDSGLETLKVDKRNPEKKPRRISIMASQTDLDDPRSKLKKVASAKAQDIRKGKRSEKFLVRREEMKRESQERRENEQLEKDFEEVLGYKPEMSKSELLGKVQSLENL